MAAKYPTVNNYLKLYGDAVTNEQKTRLKGFNKGGEGRNGSLEESLGNKPFNNGSSFRVNFFMNEYGLFVDKGVQGWQSGTTGKGGRSSIYKYKPKDGTHKPAKRSAFLESLFKWTARKGLPKGAAFAIRRNIWKFGIETTNFFSIPIARSAKRFETGLERALEKDMENNIQNRLK